MLKMTSDVTSDSPAAEESDEELDKVCETRKRKLKMNSDVTNDSPAPESDELEKACETSKRKLKMTSDVTNDSPAAESDEELEKVCVTRKRKLKMMSDVTSDSPAAEESDEELKKVCETRKRKLKMNSVVTSDSPAPESDEELEKVCKTRKRKWYDGEPKTISSLKIKQMERIHGLRANPSRFVPFQIVGKTKQKCSKLSNFCTIKCKSINSVRQRQTDRQTDTHTLSMLREHIFPPLQQTVSEIRCLRRG